jgi:hypothetical protein
MNWAHPDLHNVDDANFNERHFVTATPLDPARMVLQKQGRYLWLRRVGVGHLALKEDILNKRKYPPEKLIKISTIDDII